MLLAAVLTGQWLATVCGTPTPAQCPEAAALRESVCHTFLLGVAGGVELAQSATVDGKKAPRIYCASEPKASVLRGNALKHLREHPDAASRPADEAVVASLVATYPCKGKE